MGSSYSYSYYGTKSKSQPYSSSYSVMPVMKKKDIENGVYNGVYTKNPTAVNITNSDIDYVMGKNANGMYTYAVNIKGEVIVGKRNGNGKDGMQTPHPTLIGGENPKVKIAGMVQIKNGKIVKIDNLSGHFKPNIKSMSVAYEAFGKLPKKLFDKNYIGGK